MKKICFALLLSCLPCLHAQKVEDTGTTIHSETRVVLVDSVITDKKGGYVRGLTQKDFRVWEDGKEQTVNSFLFQAEAPSAEDQTHYMVLFFDNSTVQSADQVYARKAATQFVDSNAGPKRQIAIMEYRNGLRVTQNFTDDKDRLKQVINNFQFSGTILPGQAAAHSLLDALRRAANGLAKTPGRKTMVLLSGGFRWADDFVPELNATISACNRNNVAIYPIDIRGLVVHGLLLPGAGAGLAAMAAMPVAFQGRGGGSGAPAGGGAAGGTSGGAGGTRGAGGASAPAPSPSPTAGAGATGGPSRTASPSQGGNPVAGRSGPTSPGGGGFNQNQFPNQIQQQRRSPLISEDLTTSSGVQQVLYALASGTGGFVIANTNDLLGGLEKIGREQNEYYVVGYSPKEELKPGACHTLKVKVDRSGLNVRARTGYCDSKPIDILSGTSAERDLETKVKGNAQGNVSATLQAPFFYTGNNTARINIALEVPGDTLRFIKEKGHQQATFNVIGTALLPDGAVAARFSDSVKIAFDDKKQLEQFEKKPYHYEKQFEVASGNYKLRVAFASGGDNFGRVDLPVEIEKWSPQQFSLSGLALSKSAVPAAQGALNFNEVLEDQTPLLVNGVRVIPSATHHFRKSEQGLVYAEIYEPALMAPDGKDVPGLGISVMLLDAAGKTIKQDFGLSRVSPLPGATSVPVGLRLPFDKIAPGTYLLAVTAVDAAEKKFTRASTIVIDP